MSQMSDLNKWEELAKKELRGKPLESLTKKTPEGIDIKPLYSAKDLENVEFINNLPGFEPYVRGPKATMYEIGRASCRERVCLYV